ncbi:DNA translocase FtsK 4TM domain-containing protein [Helicobacter aurati]|uniref:DNA translocase FtsK 4TM domain-containing protein n=1 Tax=Helicobacter aurati TaxID=137778 RepID=UPI002278DF17|nr:DNA translocase FtsK 4TM domain-containing protein [Helicobacter aurati]
MSCLILFLWITIIFGYTDPNIALQGVQVENKFFKIDSFGSKFANFNIQVFGYLAYIYLPLLLFPLYRLYDNTQYSFRKIQLTFATLLCFLSLLILQSLIFGVGVLGNEICNAIASYIGIPGVIIVILLLAGIALFMAWKKGIVLMQHRIGEIMNAAFISLQSSFKKMQMMLKDIKLSPIERVNRKILNTEYSEVQTITKNPDTFNEPLIDKVLDERTQSDTNHKDNFITQNEIQEGNGVPLVQNTVKAKVQETTHIFPSTLANSQHQNQKSLESTEVNPHFDGTTNSILFNPKKDSQIVSKTLHYNLDNIEQRVDSLTKNYIPRTQIVEMQNDDTLKKFHKLPKVKSEIAIHGIEQTKSSSQEEESSNILKSFVKPIIMKVDESNFHAQPKTIQISESNVDISFVKKSTKTTQTHTFTPVSSDISPLQIESLTHLSAHTNLQKEQNTIADIKYFPQAIKDKENTKDFSFIRFDSAITPISIPQEDTINPAKKSLRKPYKHTTYTSSKEMPSGESDSMINILDSATNGTSCLIYRESTKAPEEILTAHTDTNIDIQHTSQQGFTESEIRSTLTESDDNTKCNNVEQVAQAMPNVDNGGSQAHQIAFNTTSEIKEKNHTQDEEHSIDSALAISQTSTELSNKNAAIDINMGLDSDTSHKSIIHNTVSHDSSQSISVSQPVAQDYANAISHLNLSDSNQSNTEPVAQESQSVQSHDSSNNTVQLEEIKTTEDSQNQPNNYHFPPLSLLQLPVHQEQVQDTEIDSKIANLLNKLHVFKIRGDIVRVFTGPVVTTFEFRPEPDVKVNKVQSLQDDLAMALKAKSIRIQAPIPGKDVIGIEIPNGKTQTIYLRDVLESSMFLHSPNPLSITLGKDIMGNIVIENLAKLPHLLVAGTTGSGKSVGVNALILSLLYRNSPDDLKLMMIDPKQVEFAPYEDLPHLITPLINAPDKAVQALYAATIEMDKRYKILSDAKMKNIHSYNEKIDSKMPFFVIVIDELADLIMTGGKDAEASITRIAQMGRAAGMHLIVATQRSSVDVVTGLIKTNLPSRISYRVGNKTDSKVILDEFGAERLLGNGDGLFKSVDSLKRIHAPWVSEQEIESIVDFIKKQRAVQYDTNFLSEQKSSTLNSSDRVAEGGLLEEAKMIILRDNKASISNLQRRLSIGYNKAATIIESLQAEGFLSAPNTKGERTILGS